MPLAPTRRELVAAAAAVGALGMLPLALRAATEGLSIRPFRAEIPEEALADLHRRIAATRWPDRETVADRSQGVQLAKLQELLRHWGAEYDWRRAEARLNALPQFMTEIDGLDIHFIHVRSRHPSALPLIMTHGWPGSVFELLNTVGPLTDPTDASGRDLALGILAGADAAGVVTVLAPVGRATVAGLRLGLVRLDAAFDTLRPGP